MTDFVICNIGESLIDRLKSNIVTTLLTLLLLPKARYTLATKLNSTRSTKLNFTDVLVCMIGPIGY